MGRFSLWRLRAGWLRWIFLIVPITIIWAIIQEWVFSDLVDYIRRILGVNVNIIELALKMPITLVAICAIVAIGIWIFKKGDRDFALRDLYKLLLDIREAESSLVTNAIPDVVDQHKREMNREIDLLVLQGLKRKGRSRDYNITPEELSGKRIGRLIPENAELERLRSKDGKSKLSKLWGNVRLLQTAFMDDTLDKRIARFERMLKLNSAYKVYKEVVTSLYIISLDDCKILNKPVRVIGEALDKAHIEVNQRLVELVSDKERSKAKSWIKQVARQ